MAALLLLTFAAPMRAQVFHVEEDENQRLEEDVFGNGEWNNIIVHGSDDDQANFVPVGGGILLLSALGGAYLLKKKKNNK